MFLKGTPTIKPETKIVFEFIESFPKCMESSANLPDDQKVMCFRKCVLEKVGYFNETNGLNLEYIANQEKELGHRLYQTVYKPLYERCAFKKEESESYCDWANRIFECIPTY